MIGVRKVRDLVVEPGQSKTGSAHISAASSLVKVDGHLLVIADDEMQLGVFAARGDEPGYMIDILEGNLASDESDRKRHKPDLEAIEILPRFARHPHGAALALGSGTGDERMRAALVSLDERGHPTTDHTEIDLSPLYLSLKRDIPELNIEGAVLRGGTLHLMQRGNNGGGRNARIELDLQRCTETLELDRALGPAAVVDIAYYDLGRTHGVALSFSDASALPDGRIVFACSAEDTSDPHEDGPTLGSGIGILERDGELCSVEPVELDVKIEGLAATPRAGGIEVLMVTDADDPSVPSPLLAARL